MTIKLRDALPLVQGANGYDKWSEWLEERDPDEALEETLHAACSDGVEWGARALGLREAMEQYEAVERPAWEQYIAVERPALKSLIAAIIVRCEQLLQEATS